MQKKHSIRTLKKDVKKKLTSSEFCSEHELTKSFSKEQLIAPLISFFCSTDPLLKWRSITVFSRIVDITALENMEKARVIMRRLMWTLNEESGGVGWGAPESMGEIMRINDSLAEEYHKILFSYIDDHGNFLDYEPLQIGVLWGIYSLSKRRPDLVIKSLPAVREYFSSDNGVGRGLALKIAENTNDVSSENHIRELITDETEITLFDDGHFIKIQLSRLAKKVLLQFSKK